jgi:hypothetical protein
VIKADARGGARKVPGELSIGQIPRMIHVAFFIRAVALALLCLPIAAAGQTTRIPESRWFEFKPGGLRAAPSGYALEYGLPNTSKQPQWVTSGRTRA